MVWNGNMNPKIVYLIGNLLSFLARCSQLNTPRIRVPNLDIGPMQENFKIVNIIASSLFRIT